MPAMAASHVLAINARLLFLFLFHYSLASSPCLLHCASLSSAFSSTTLTCMSEHLINEFLYVCGIISYYNIGREQFRLLHDARPRRNCCCVLNILELRVEIDPFWWRSLISVCTFFSKKSCIAHSSLYSACD